MWATQRCRGAWRFCGLAACRLLRLFCQWAMRFWTVSQSGRVPAPGVLCHLAEQPFTFSLSARRAEAEALPKGLGPSRLLAGKRGRCPCGKDRSDGHNLVTVLRCTASSGSVGCLRKPASVTCSRKVPLSEGGWICISSCVLLHEFSGVLRNSFG